ncbi:MAG: hypothetical protein JO289_19180 [Xanthobacteraceae bacterium]|nr:hypothetical protein [Xanthobacteraceae bacterium]
MARMPNAGAVERPTGTRVFAKIAGRCTVVALTALALAGCFEANSDGAAPAAGVNGGPGGANAATIAAPVPAAVSSAAPVTVQKARADCWMDLENNKKAPHDLEQRNKVVEQCVTAKMNGQASR